MMKTLIRYITQAFNAVATLSYNIRHYFKSGSFAIAIYPYLMHPCFHKIAKWFTVLLGIGVAYGGVFYLFGEHVTILFSERSITTYIHHSTLELFFPIGSVIDDKESTLSNLPQVMRAIFSYQSYLFIPFYLLGIYWLSLKRFWILELLLAVCFAIGSGMVSEITSGRYSEGGLQNFGLSLTIIIGNLMLILVAFDLPKTTWATWRKWSIILGLIGLSCVSITLFYPTIFSPVLERMSLYSIMIWEIIAGFSLIQNALQTDKYEEDSENEIC